MKNISSVTAALGNGLVYGLLRDQVTRLVNKNRIESPRGLS